MTADVFVSFASKDVRVAMTLCTALESRGFSCWISARDIEPGANFQSSIVRALRRAKIMLLVFTANSNTSEEMTKELALASQNKMIVIPLRVEDVTPNDAFAYEFATRQWIDVFADWEVAMEQLARRVSNALLERQAGLATNEASDALMSVMSAAAASRAGEPPHRLPDPEPAPQPEPVPAAQPAWRLSETEPDPETMSAGSAEAPSPKATPRLPLLVAGGVAAVMAIGIAVAVVSTAKHPSAVHATSAKATGPSKRAAGGAAPAAKPAWPKVEQGAQALLAAAKGAGQAPDQIAGLSASVAKISALAVQARAASAPGAAARLPAVVSQIDGEATRLAQGEAADLDHAAQAPARQAERILGKASKAGSSNGSNALAAMTQAKTKLQAATDGVSQASDATASLQAALGAVTAYGEFTSAFKAATPYFVPAEQAQLSALAAETRAMSARIESYAGKSKPWFLAPQRQKQAYQTLQSNAAQARGRQAELEALVRTATRSATLGALDAALARASVINKTMKGLYASSYAAYSVK
jgi:hypothetical protein